MVAGDQNLMSAANDWKWLNRDSTLKQQLNITGLKIFSQLFKPVLNDLYDTACMIQLVWLYKIANSYKLDVQILVWLNFWKIGWVLSLPTCMKEIGKSYFTFCNADELFWRKSSLMNLKTGDLLFNKFLWEVKNQGGNKRRKNGEDESEKKILNCL